MNTASDVDVRAFRQKEGSEAVLNLLDTAELIETDDAPATTTESESVHPSEQEESSQAKTSKPEDEPKTPAESIVEELEPWGQEVNLAPLVVELEKRIQRHLILSAEARLAVSLWVVGSYVYNSFRIFPRAVLHSPEKRCGKTTLMEILHAMVPRGLLSSSISPAAVFRVIEDCRPTLLIDEADSFLKDNEPLRGIINSSHTKAGAFVVRCDGDSNAPRKFSTWAPIVIAGIQRVADTIMDRSIIIELQRKGIGETVDRLPTDLDEILQPLRRKLARWAKDNGNLLRSADPELPESENDRARDNWFPLFALADAMGGEWRERTQHAFLTLAGQAEDEALGTMLLSDVRTIFQDRGVKSVWSCDIVHDLGEMEERPWPNWKGGFTARILANMLKSYGISSGDVRKADGVKKGYKFLSFHAAFARYLPPTP